MKTQTYSGTLVDAACAMPGSASMGSSGMTGSNSGANQSDRSMSGSSATAGRDTTTSSSSSTGRDATASSTGSETDRSMSGQSTTGQTAAERAAQNPSSSTETNTNEDRTASGNDRNVKTSASAETHSSTTGAANRSADSDSCPVSSSTTQFALKMNDGKTVMLDDVGNTRARELIARKNWSSTSGKSLKVKASGVLNGDRLTVVSIK